MDIKQHSFITTNALAPVGPAQDLFISGASIFEITDFEPTLQRASIVGVNLPEPDVFGPYDSYVAILDIPGEQGGVLTQIGLEPTTDLAIWGGSTLLEFGGTLPPITATVHPLGDGTQVGPAILQGAVFGQEPENEV